MKESPLQIHKSFSNYNKIKGSVVTTGTFDGVHLGHQKIIEVLTETAKAENLTSVVVTFDPHPRTIIFPNDASIKLLNTLDEKIRIFEKCGIEHLIIQRFDLDFSHLSFKQYIKDYLIEKLDMKKLVVGYDHHFGKNREGSIENIRELEPEYHFSAIEVPAHEIDQVQISSTKIRNALLDGDVTLANSYLGYAYEITGKVINGDKIGRTLGYPTANLQLEDPFKLIPGDGVYAVEVVIKGKKYQGMMSIGPRPTFNDVKHTYEVNIFNFDQDIYNTSISVHFIEKIRGIVKFNGKEALIEELKQDKTKTLRIFNNEA